MAEVRIVSGAYNGATSNTFGRLYRNSAGQLLTTPSWLLSGNLFHKTDTRRRYATWYSDDYYPDKFPGSYGRSECMVGAVGLLENTEWSYQSGNPAASASWGPYEGTGITRSVGVAHCGIGVYTTSALAGTNIDRIRVVSSVVQKSSGSGDCMVGVMPWSSSAYPFPFPLSLSLLAGSVSENVSAGGTFDLECSLVLDNYLILTCFIGSSFAPPTNPSRYPGFDKVSFSANLTNMRVA